MPAPAGKQSVLVLMPNIRFQNKESLYWGRLLEGISRELEAQGLGMIIVSESRVDHFIHVLNPDGILGMIGVGQIDSSLLLEVHRFGIPMVLVDHEDVLIPTDTVFANNGDSIARLCNYLIGLGHTCIHFIGNVEFSRSFRDRWHGYREALENNGLESLSLKDPMLMLKGVDTGDFVPDFEEWIMARKSAHQMPTALVCANDAIAIRVLEVLKNIGIHVPGEITVTGFDNIDDAYRSEPTLTTVHVSKEAMGRRAVKNCLSGLLYLIRCMKKFSFPPKSYIAIPAQDSRGCRRKIKMASHDSKSSCEPFFYFSKTFFSITLLLFVDNNDNKM
ncbi:hypothetical protein HMSSN139_20160 [Paenibacillus sp. HMSSN-139]|nr:hypothetical protein HMSSN139_20160 [Paenibacillus sp. HMSSN-139]